MSEALSTLLPPGHYDPEGRTGQETQNQLEVVQKPLTMTEDSVAS